MRSPTDMDLQLDNAELGLVVSTTGGSVWDFHAKAGAHAVPLFRAPPAGTGRTALLSGCFPMVPFGNRVRGNCFGFAGRDYALTPNMPSDRHYLHGDGWTGEWQVVRHEPERLSLAFEQDGPGTPYVYTAEQSFVLDGPTLEMTLRVTNTGEEALPFGLGWHPFFPLTPHTTLQARTRSFWEEDAHWLPTVERTTGGDLDFGHSAPVPRRWINTQYEGWDGAATIRWPERPMALRITADPLFDRCLVFVSDPAFDPGYTYDFFCFEPMSHSVDDHNRPEAGGLRRLAPGEALSGSVRFTLDRLSA